ncbi:MAG: menaquinone biosynthesis decarboxylase [Holophagales bacterium]|nr:menaquinone biosynthesis decarboxylase [Holophagales bacterium]
MGRDLQSFLQQLESLGELHRVKAEVDPYLEMAAVACAVAKQPNGGQALLFEKPKSGVAPVAMNVYGSLRRMEMVLNVEKKGLDSIGQRIEKLMEAAIPKPGGGLLEKLAKLPMLADVSNWMPKSVHKGICQEIVKKGADARLGELPALTTWPEDGGPFITMGMSHALHKDGRRNMGLYRLQVHDDHTLGFHAQVHHDGSRALHGYAPGERMPVSVAFGGDPALLYAATAPLPPFVPELIFTGFLLDKGIEIVKCLTNGIEVPADSELVIEGWVDPAESRLEGPFGDHTGYYSPADMYPIMHVEAITHRRNFVFPATVVGPPPQEDSFLGLATERIFLPILRLILPEIRDMHLPAAGAFHNLAIISIKKEYPGHCQKVMNAIWGMGQMMLTKCIIVVDEDIDPHDAQEVLFRITSNVDPERDLLFSKGPLDALDHASGCDSFGSKVGIDATRKNRPFDNYGKNGGNGGRKWPKDLVYPREILEKIEARWGEYGLPASEASAG